MVRESEHDPVGNGHEFEKAVVGALLLEPDAIRQVFSILRAEHFSHPIWRVVYGAAVELHGEGRGVDALLLKDYLQRTGRWRDGYDAELAGAVASIMSVANIRDHAVLVIKAALERRTRSWAAEVAAGREAASLEDLLLPIRELQAELDTIRSAPLGDASLAERIRAAFVSAAELAEEAPERVEWVAEPWAAKGTVTAFDGLPKGGGKTTFLLHIVRAVLAGLQFLGRLARRCPVVYLTEEPRASFLSALRRADLLGHPDLHILFRQRAKGVPWPDVVRGAISKCEEVGAELLIIDTFLPFAGLRGDAENSSGAVQEALEPLLEATEKGIAVIVSRHERKAQGEVGSSGRGSNAFTGAVDTVITIRRPKGGSDGSVRVLSGLSRLDGVPGELSVRLEQGGFVTLDEAARKLGAAAAAILRAAPPIEEAASRVEDLAEAAGLGRTAAQKAIEHLVAHGQVKWTGKGVKNNPKRFWAPNEPGDSFRQESTSKGQKGIDEDEEEP